MLPRHGRKPHASDAGGAESQAARGQGNCRRWGGRRFQLADFADDRGRYRAMDDLGSDADRTIGLARQRGHDRAGRIHREREAATGLKLCGSRKEIAMAETELREIYRAYIACLNRQGWAELAEFVRDEVYYNGQRIGLSGYRAMLEKDFHEIPDLHFDIQLLISDPPYIASRLRFDCGPKGMFLGLHVNGKRVRFTENVFYKFESEKIEQVWSVIDKAAIEAQL
jgi:predicted ester cyclase